MVYCLFIIAAIFIQATLALPTSFQACTSGETFVQNNILYDCLPSESGQAHAKPIACAPEGDKNKSLLKPGEAFTTEHFKYQCEEDQGALVLKVINCIDSTGMLVDVGNFFTMEDENGNHQTTECLGDYFKVKKTVLQWTKCTLPSGTKVTEGNFHVEPLTLSSPNKHALQKGEIISCIRNGKEVGLKCTGCVTEHTSIHVGISGYVEVKGQWTQCRRTNDGCRLVNVTRNYVDCQLRGSSASYQNGIYFNDTNGISTYFCNHGVVSKQGCTIDGQWALVGEVIYASSGEPFLCDSSASYSSFNGLKGCVLPDGSAKKFQEVWKEGEVMKRCYWKNGASGPSEALIVSYACAKNNEVIPENKIIQRDDGSLEKCTKNADGELGIRRLTDKERKDYIKKKTLRLDFLEYFANGGKGNIETFTVPSLSDSPTSASSESALTTDLTSQPHPAETEPTLKPFDDTPTTTEDPISASTLTNSAVMSSQTQNESVAFESCTDLVPFCNRLSSYCPDFDRYQLIDGDTGKDTIPSAIVELQEFAEFFKLRVPTGDSRNKGVSPCEAHFLTHQRKLKLLVDVICPKTCNSCLQPEQVEKVLTRLQDASRCG